MLDVQRSLGLLLRSKVAGDDAAQRAEQIWGKPGERWFSSADPIWRVHRDASMFVGGITALLLQSLQPMAMAGVAGHSGYKSDPWGRLQRTSHYLAVTTFGTIPDAEAAIAKVRSVHHRVRGRDDRGRAYSASDPRLLKWVHLAEADSFLRAHQAFGAEPLTPAEADTYVAQAGVPAGLLGVLDPPGSVAELTAQLAAYRPELEATPAAREAARFLLLDPPLPLLARPGYGTLAAGAVSLLPPWARSALQLPLPDVLTDLIGRPLGRFSVGVVRWALAGVPDGR
ncbi:MAG: DUF2236 domain-containing protein [Propionibacteriaceae bacterium]|nr:DUF2236 domain-containing protein [Propionibacteriaceae bacterium]